MRSALPPESLLPSLRGAVAAIDPGLPLFDVRTMDDVVRASLARERFLLALFALFAALAIVLAAIGVYGVTADATAVRRREIAVRMALGARVRDVVRLTIGRELAAVAVASPRARSEPSGSATR